MSGVRITRNYTEFLTSCS